MFKNNQIIITSNVNKINLLKKLNNQLLNIKIYSLNEFNKLYYFDYDEETIFFVMSKYKIKYEIAKIYLDNMYFIESKKYKNKKLLFLTELKEELISKKLIKINNLFKNILKNKDIVFYNLPISKETDNLIKILSVDNNVSTIQEEHNIYQHQIYELQTIEDEVEYIANSICNLIKSGVNISNIFLNSFDNASLATASSGVSDCEGTNDSSSVSSSSPTTTFKLNVSCW